MRNAFITAAILIAAVLVVGCAQQVDEELLPTLVPQVDMQTLVQAAEDARPTPRPTPTNTPIPTPTAEDIADSDASGDQSSVVITYGDVVVESAAEEATEAPGEESSPEDTQPQNTDAADDPSTVVVESTPETASVAAEDDTVETATEEPVAEPTVQTEATPVVEASASDSDVVSNTMETDIAATSAVTETVDSELSGAETNGVDATDEEEAVTDVSSDSESGELVDMSLPESVLAAIDSADLMRGEQLILTTGCTGCHSMDRDSVFVGPSWYDLATTSANRVDDMSAEIYMYRSLLYPNEYVVEGFENSAMLPNYEETLTDQDIGDLIGYMLTLRAR